MKQTHAQGPDLLLFLLLLHAFGRRRLFMCPKPGPQFLHHLLVILNLQRLPSNQLLQLSRGLDPGEGTPRPASVEQLQLQLRGKCGGVIRTL